MKQFIILICFFTVYGCGKAPNAENDEKFNKEFLFDNVNYGTVEINGKYWTAINFLTPMLGGTDVQTTFPSDFVTGKLYTSANIAAIKTPNGYRVPTKDDFLNLIQFAGGTSTWTPVKDDNNVNGQVYEITDLSVINKLLSADKWQYLIANNQTGFNAQPTVRTTEDPATKTELTTYLGNGGQQKVYLEIKTLENRSGYVRLYVFEHYHTNESGKYSLRFVKDK